MFPDKPKKRPVPTCEKAGCDDVETNVMHVGKMAARLCDEHCVAIENHEEFRALGEAGNIHEVAADAHKYVGRHSDAVAATMRVYETQKQMRELFREWLATEGEK